MEAETLMEFIKRLEKMLETMSPGEVVASLSDEEKLKLSKMITNMNLYTVIQKAIGD